MKDYYSSESAGYIGDEQFNYVQEEWFKRLFRMDVWKGRGRTLSAALWSFNHGIDMEDGAIMSIGEYYKVRNDNLLDLCGIIYKEGGMVIGLKLYGDPENWYDPNGVYIGEGTFKGMGHALHICGYDLNKECLIYKGSYGPGAFKNGYGEIPITKISHIGDTRIIRKCKFQLPAIEK